MEENKLVASLSLSIEEAKKSIDETGKYLEKKLSKSATDASKSVSKEIKKAEPERGFAEGFGSSLLTTMPAIASSLYVGEKAFQAIRVAGEKFFNVFEGEKLLKIDKNFNNIAKSFGVAGDEIKDAFIKATGGITDDDDAVASLTEKMVTFSGHVDKMPALFEASRKAAKLFGGEALDMFEKLSMAAQTGNTRSIRFIFPKLDLENELKTYATSIGKTVEDLKEWEIQQFRVNKILAESDKRLSGVGIQADTVTEKYAAWKVQISNVGEEINKKFTKWIGGFLGPMLDNDIKMWTRWAEALSDTTPIERLIEKHKELSGEIDKLNNKKYGMFIDQSQLAGDKLALQQLREELDKVSLAMYSAQDAKDQAEMDAAHAPKEKAQGPSRAFLELRNNLFKKYNDQAVQAESEYQSKMLGLTTDAAQKRTIATQMFWNRELQENQRHKENLESIAKDLRDKNLISQKEYENGSYQNMRIYNQLKEIEDKRHKTAQLSNTAEFQKNMKDYQDQGLASNTSNLDAMSMAYDSFFEGMRKKSEDTANSMKKNFEEIGKSAMQSMGNSLAKSFKAFVTGATDAKQTLSDFFNSFIAAMGDLLIQHGAGYVIEGAALGILGDPRGGPLMSVGGGMMALGGAMAAYGAKSKANMPSEGYSGTSTGGGVTGGSLESTPETSLTRPEDAKIANPKAQVVINVQGNILNNRESSLFIADSLSDAFREQDINFVGA